MTADPKNFGKWVKKASASNKTENYRVAAAGPADGTSEGTFSTACSNS